MTFRDKIICIYLCFTAMLSLATLAIFLLTPVRIETGSSVFVPPKGIATLRVEGVGGGGAGGSGIEARTVVEHYP